MQTAKPSNEPSDPLVGRLLDGRYKVVEKIAAGGMGAVYRAVQEPLGRSVAIKVLSVDAKGPSADAFRQRFFREASLCARLKHPNTVRIHDYGQTKDDIYYIAMEFLDGETLRDAMGSGTPMNPMRAIDLMTQICASLSEAHALGLIHRDLKPSNIILTVHADGKEYANVVDFGLVKDIDTIEPGTTETGVIVGSPSYMSPEQIMQGDLDERSDIYSLGVLLYVMLTGRKPFRQESLAAVIQRHLHVAPPEFEKANPGGAISPSLEWVTMTCLNKEPKDRFASAAELARALRACSLEITGRFPRVEMSLTEGRVRLPASVTSIVDHSRTGMAPRVHSQTQPTLARQIEPSGTRARIPLMMLLGGPAVFMLLAAMLAIGIAIGLGIYAFSRPAPTTTPAVTVPLPAPAPAPVPAVGPTERPQPVVEPAAPAPRPAAPAPVAPRPEPPPRPQPTKPRPQPPKPKPAPGPAPAQAPPSPPAPSPAAPQPQPATPAPDKWGTVGDDLVNPWAKKK